MGKLGNQTIIAGGMRSTLILTGLGQGFVRSGTGPLVLPVGHNLRIPGIEFGNSFAALGKETGGLAKKIKWQKTMAGTVCTYSEALLITWSISLYGFWLGYTNLHKCHESEPKLTSPGR